MTRTITRAILRSQRILHLTLDCGHEQLETISGNDPRPIDDLLRDRCGPHATTRCYACEELRCTT